MAVPLLFGYHIDELVPAFIGLVHPRGHLVKASVGLFEAGSHLFKDTRALLNKLVGRFGELVHAVIQLVDALGVGHALPLEHGSVFRHNTPGLTADTPPWCPEWWMKRLLAISWSYNATPQAEVVSRS